LVKAPSSGITTQTNFNLELLEECDIIQQCHNIEEAPHTSFEEETDLDPRAEFEENCPTFDKLVVQVQFNS